MHEHGKQAHVVEYHFAGPLVARHTRDNKATLGLQTIGSSPRAARQLQWLPTHASLLIV
jgi:hypothetical protein